MGNPASGSIHGATSEPFANAHQTCQANRLTTYQLLRLAANGSVRTVVNPYGRTLYHLGDASRFAGARARA